MSPMVGALKAASRQRLILGVTVTGTKPPGPAGGIT